MTDRTSPLAQRVRRLLGTSNLDPEQPSVASSRAVPDTGALFDSHISRLSRALHDLRAIDRAREAELRALRDQLRAADCRTRAALAELDALIDGAERLAGSPIEAPTAATLFERMRARSAGTSLDPAQREALAEWTANLRRLRESLSAPSE